MQRKPRALSGGQRQRVAMGRAIVRGPQVFLMDEPLSNLDAKLRVETRAEIAGLQDDLGVTTIYVTHDQVEAMTMGDRVAVMRKGELQQVDAPQTLYDHPVNLFVCGFLGSPAMNLFEATLETRNGEYVAKLGEERTAIKDDEIKARPGLAAYAGKEIVLGIRPEDFEDATRPARRGQPHGRSSGRGARLAIVVDFALTARPGPRGERARRRRAATRAATTPPGATRRRGGRFCPRGRERPGRPRRRVDADRHCCDPHAGIRCSTRRASGRRADAPVPVTPSGRARITTRTWMASRVWTACARSWRRGGSPCRRETLRDPPAAETVHGLGARKNELVLELLERDGVEAYEGSVRYVRAVRDAGLRRAVVSSSANCRRVLEAAGIADLFEVRVDGIFVEKHQLRGKPAPDAFLAAARALGVVPAEAAVFEDALAGVEAGRAGIFGFVVGVDRADQTEALRSHGADVVVDDLQELLR